MRHHTSRALGILFLATVRQRRSRLCQALECEAGLIHGIWYNMQKKRTLTLIIYHVAGPTSTPKSSGRSTSLAEVRTSRPVGRRSQLRSGSRFNGSGPSHHLCATIFGANGRSELGRTLAKTAVLAGRRSRPIWVSSKLRVDFVAYLRVTFRWG